MLVGLKRISAAVGLWACATAATYAQAPVPTTNQATANAVANELRSSRALSGHRIEIETRDGVVTLKGTVATPAQKAEALSRARHVAGVLSVTDQIKLAGDSRVRRAQFQQLAMGHHGRGAAGGEEIIYDGGATADGAPIMNGGMGQPGAGVPGGPLPEGAAGVQGMTAGPGAPNYAWPSYAPYPNYSAVGYPTAYPWQAWPNIAPPYPYPEIPLDWRAVTLRWDDGIWWLDFKKNYTRPFFTPYPFGIFAY